MSDRPGKISQVDGVDKRKKGELGEGAKQVKNFLRPDGLPSTAKGTLEKEFGKDTREANEFTDRKNKEALERNNIEYDANKRIVAKNLENVDIKDIRQVKETDEGYSYKDKDGNKQEITEKGKLNDINKDLSSLELQKKTIPDAIEKPLLDHLAMQENNDNLKEGIVHHYDYDKQNDQLKVYVVPEVKEQQDGSGAEKIKDGEMKEFSIDLNKLSPDEKTNLTDQVKKNFIEEQIKNDIKGIGGTFVDGSLKIEGDKYYYESQYEEKRKITMEGKLHDDQKKDLDKYLSSIDLNKLSPDEKTNLTDQVKKNFIEEQIKNDIRGIGGTFVDGSLKTEGDKYYYESQYEEKRKITMEGKLHDDQKKDLDKYLSSLGLNDDKGLVSESDQEPKKKNDNSEGDDKEKIAEQEMGKNSARTREIKPPDALIEKKSIGEQDDPAKRMRNEEAKSKRISNFDNLLRYMEMGNNATYQGAQGIEAVIEEILHAQGGGGQQMPLSAASSQMFADSYRDNRDRKIEAQRVAQDNQKLEESNKIRKDTQQDF